MPGGTEYQNLNNAIRVQIEEFHPKFWPGELYHDVDKQFYKALGNGSHFRIHLILIHFILL